MKTTPFRQSVLLTFFFFALFMFLSGSGCKKIGNTQQSELRSNQLGDEDTDVYLKVLGHLKRLKYKVGKQPLEGGASFIPEQFVVWSETPQARDLLRKAASAKYQSKFKVVKSCGCGNRLQMDLWEIKGIQGNEQGNSGKDKVVSSVGVEEIEENLYLFPFLPANRNPNAKRFRNLNKFVHKPGSKTGDPIVIAILDSGIDYAYQDSLVGTEPRLVFWNGAKKQKDFCLPRPPFYGWDFVNNDNNPMDDHSHGTHISGIVAEQLRVHKPDLNYQLMAVKILDENGVGTSFDAACGVLFATVMEADLINASWGYYGVEDNLLRRVFHFAEENGVFTANSAGNEQVDLAYIPHNPTLFAIDDQKQVKGITFVSALAANGKLLPGTNYRTEGVKQDGFIAMPGENITSLIPVHFPKNFPKEKSGTSVSAPVMTAIVATYKALYPNDPPDTMRLNIHRQIISSVKADSIRANGKKYPYYPLKWLEIESGSPSRKK